MVGAGVGRRQQQEDEIDRQLVDRLEVDRRRQPGEIAEHAGQALDLAVRDGDAAAEAGRADLLARVEAAAIVLGRQAGQPRRRRGELLEQGLLVGRDQIGVDRRRRSDMSERSLIVCTGWERGGSRNEGK